MLINDQGTMVTDEQGIEELVLSFYKQLLGSRAPRLLGLDMKVVKMGPSLTHDECVSLIRPVSYKEIDDALNSIHSHKAPGIDRFNAFFYKKV